MKKIGGLGKSSLPQIMLLNGGGKITVSLIQETHDDHGGETSSNRSILDDHDGDDVDTRLGLSTPVSSIPAVTLRWYRPPDADCNGVDDDRSNPTVVEVDSNSDNMKSPHDDVIIQEKYYFPASYATTFLDVAEVDTTLRLSNYTPAAKNNPRPEPDHDEVDTTLSPHKSRMHKRRADAVEDRVEKKTRSARRNNAGGEDQLPLLPIEQIPTLLQAVESRGGTWPFFLYRKELVDSDVKQAVRDEGRENDGVLDRGGGRGGGISSELTPEEMCTINWA